MEEKHCIYILKVGMGLGGGGRLSGIHPLPLVCLSCIIIHVLEYMTFVFVDVPKFKLTLSSLMYSPLQRQEHSTGKRN